MTTNEKIHKLPIHKLLPLIMQRFMVNAVMTTPMNLAEIHVLEAQAGLLRSISEKLLIPEQHRSLCANRIQHTLERCRWKTGHEKIIAEIEAVIHSIREED